MADIQPIKTDEICDDPQIAYFKQKQMQKFKTHSLLQSFSETFKYIAGILTTVGMAVTLPAFIPAASGGALAAGLAAVPVFGWALLGAAAVATAVAVSSYYSASKIWVDGQFNNYEISAKSTAHHMVQELEANHLCMSENQGRADGKTWCQYNEKRKTTIQPAQSL